MAALTSSENDQFFSSFLLWEFVHVKVYKFALGNRALVAKPASLTLTCIRAITGFATEARQTKIVFPRLFSAVIAGEFCHVSVGDNIPTVYAVCS